MKVLSIGESTYEIYVNVDNYPLEGSINKYQERIENGSGIMNNISYMLAKWGEESYLASVVGTDDYGNKIKRELETVGARIDFIETAYEKGTNVQMLLHNKSNGYNTVFNLNNGITLKKYSFSVTPDIIIIDGTDYPASLASMDKYHDAKKIMVIDTPTKENIDLTKYCDYLILSLSAAENLANQRVDYNNSMSIVNIYNAIKQRFNRPDLLINISGYGTIYNNNGEIKILPTLTTVNRIDLAGELEAFVGAFTYGLGNNYDIEKCACYATIAASFATGNLTARGSIPAKEEVINYYNAKFGIPTPQEQVTSSQLQVQNVGPSPQVAVAPEATPNNQNVNQ